VREARRARGEEKSKRRGEEQEERRRARGEEKSKRRGEEQEEERGSDTCMAIVFFVLVGFRHLFNG